MFLLGLAVVFVTQLIEGLSVVFQPGNTGDVETIAILVVSCFFIGIARSWQVIGGPSIGITSEVTQLVRRHEHGEAPASEAHGDAPPPASSGPATG